MACLCEHENGRRGPISGLGPRKWEWGWRVRMEDPWTFQMSVESITCPQGVDQGFKLIFPPLSSRGQETPAASWFYQLYLHEALICIVVLIKWARAMLEALPCVFHFTL